MKESAVGWFCEVRVVGGRWRILAREGTGRRAWGVVEGWGWRCACRASVGPGGDARLGPSWRIKPGKGGFWGWNRGKCFYFLGLGGCMGGASGGWVEKKLRHRGHRGHGEIIREF